MSNLRYLKWAIGSNLSTSNVVFSHALYALDIGAMFEFWAVNAKLR